MYVWAMHVCPMSTETKEVIESHGTELTNVGAAIWVLKIKHGSFETAISDLNNSAISQGWYLIFEVL